MGQLSLHVARQQVRHWVHQLFTQTWLSPQSSHRVWVRNNLLVHPEQVCLSVKISKVYVHLQAHCALNTGPSFWTDGIAVELWWTLLLQWSPETKEDLSCLPTTPPPGDILTPSPPNGTCKFSRKKDFLSTSCRLLSSPPLTSDNLKIGEIFRHGLTS